jgi:hypothetical protein
MIDPQNRYGFIRAVEADLLDEMVATIKNEFGAMRWLEIGVFSADTVRGIYRRSQAIGCSVSGCGVDFEKYRPNPTPGDNYVFHAGDSMEMWREVRGNYNMLLIDGCHCVVHASQDFLNYAPFVEVGGYVLFHDTALPTGKYEQEEWPQDHSYAGKSNSKLGVREALKKIGLLDGRRNDFKFIRELESDSGMMGMCLYRRVLPY